MVRFLTQQGQPGDLDWTRIIKNYEMTEINVVRIVPASQSVSQPSRPALLILEIISWPAGGWLGGRDLG